MYQPQIGDIVVLPTGSPDMTVAEVLPWGEVYCMWFRADGTAAGEVYPCSMLRPRFRAAGEDVRSAAA